MRSFTGVTACLLLGVMAIPAVADWDPGDPVKMTQPQLPNLNGWDISFGPLADDWTCSESGFVNDIHLWYSWRNDQVGEIGNLVVQICENDTSGPYDKPGDILWSDDFTQTIRLYDQGLQGWYDPTTGQTLPDNHYDIYQLNLTDLVNPFYQSKDTRYWLVINMVETSSQAGWKTSTSGSDVSAVFDNNGGWVPITNPDTSYPHTDLAFVITPEPTGLALMLAGLALLRRKR